MSGITTLDTLRKRIEYLRDEKFLVPSECRVLFALINDFEREISELYIPKPDVPTNKKTELTGITDIHEAARNLMGCATFAIGTGRNLTVDDFHDALGALVTIADMYYLKLPLDADGLPIRVGDTLEFGESFNQGIVKAVNECMVILLHTDCDYTNYAKYGLLWDAGSCRHVKPDPLKELLEELVSEARDDSRDFSVEPWCEEIRKMMGGDA